MDLLFFLPQPTRESPPMFESRFIDRFSRTPWWSVPLLFVPATLICLYIGFAHMHVSLLATLGLLVAGYLAWTLTEYWLHRLLFHWQPAGEFGERMHFVLHGVHHKWPRDRLRLVMPTTVSVVLFWLFLGAWLLMFGRYAYTFHAGFAIGYMFYDLSHYYMHHGHPRWRWLKDLRKHHMVHHSPKLEHEKKFGVSTTLWDHVFGTYGAAETEA
ncbi:MAG TPA: sterol desaturase family protein [Polyangiales bacterium]|nr:sterol desaturase family protein [Polyangiales bacterium]